jgi:hypothetical protein
MGKLRIVVGGFLGIMPAGGVTWDYIQYPLGFSLLGHDVFYIEDTRLYPIYQKPGSNWDDCSASVEHLKKVMDYFGLGKRWAYRDEASGKCFGLSEEEVKEICSTADVFVNISCSTFMREEYMQIPVRILIDSDPMFTQIQYVSQQMFTPGEPGLKQMLHAHTHLFTFGENIGADDCLIPSGNLQWHTTRQPVCIDFWKATPVPVNNGSAFTTLMNWTAGKKLVYNNEEWGQKDVEFYKVMQLPSKINGIKLSMVISQTGGTAQTLQQETIENCGWQILNAETLAPDWISYQGFIEHSAGEFSVAKQTYVKANTGWFSCRSACYLAAGRPVIAQDTGWSKFIPAGNGLFAFHSEDEAAEALKAVTKNLQRHATAARKIAEDYFDSNKVLTDLLKKIS